MLRLPVQAPADGQAPACLWNTSGAWAKLGLGLWNTSGAWAFFSPSEQCLSLLCHMHLCHGNKLPTCFLEEHPQGKDRFARMGKRCFSMLFLWFFHAFFGLCPAIAPSVKAALACKLLLYLHALPSCCTGGNLIHNGLLSTVGAGGAEHHRFPSQAVTALGVTGPAVSRIALCV